MTSDGISWNNGISPSSEFANILPEEARLAEVSSNFWGTKFKIAGVDADEQLPSDLGQINYKASLLHLQPRQMRLEITDLKDDEEDSGGGDADHRKGGKSTSSRSGSADFENWAAVESSDDEESDDAKLQLECRRCGHLSPFLKMFLSALFLSFPKDFILYVDC